MPDICCYSIDAELLERSVSFERGCLRDAGHTISSNVLRCVCPLPPLHMAAAQPRRHASSLPAEARLPELHISSVCINYNTKAVLNKFPNFHIPNNFSLD
jgi:hypothetical protein